MVSCKMFNYVYLFAKQHADVDECATVSTCHQDAECTNTLGSFQCSCNTGYRGNGFTCTSMEISKCYVSTIMISILVCKGGSTSKAR